MAEKINKKYHEYDAGTPAGTDIVLYGNPTTGALNKVAISGLHAPSGGYKEYIAGITQTGTNAPVATVLKNELSGPIVWSRNGDGDYRGTLVGAFLAGKVVQVLTTTLDGNTADLLGIYAGRLDDDTIFIGSTTSLGGGGGALVDGALNYAGGNAILIVRVMD